MSYGADVKGVGKMAKRIFIKFRSDKNGTRRATYFGTALRWLPISIEDAETRLVNDPRYVDVDKVQNYSTRMPV